MNNGCTRRIEVYSAAGITASADTARIAIPSGVSNFYIKTTLTETAAGGVTVTLKGNELDSITDAFTIDTLGGAQTGDNVDRAFRAALSTVNQEVLPQWVYLNIASITGTWTILCEIWYGRLGN